MIKGIACFILSPTRLIASIVKGRKEGEEAGNFIVKWNTYYWIFSIIIGVLGAILSFMTNMRKWYSITFGILLWLIPISRINEIFYAFINDAFDRLNRLDPKTQLTPEQRVKMALKGYSEVIINFGIVYYFVPVGYFDNKIINMVDSLYYSVVTITTLGYGDITPKHWLVKLMSIYELGIGLSLIVFTLAIYLGLASKNKSA